MKTHYLLISIALISSATCYANFPAISQTNSTIQKTVDKTRSDNNVPGLEVSISLPDEHTTRDFVSGTTTLDGKTNVVTGDLYQIGSNTKAFISAILLQLEAEKRLNINDPIDRYIDFSKHTTWHNSWEKITIKQLLNMTSGIFNYTSDTPFMNSIYSNPSLNTSPTQLVDIAAQHPDNFTPGNSWSYSNTDYILAGMIVKNITLQSIEQDLEDRILGSTHLNLLNTYYNNTYPQSIVNQTVHGYGKVNGKVKDLSSPNAFWAGAAGGMLANTRDMVRWVRALFSGIVVHGKQLNELQSLVCTTEDCTPGQPTTPQVGGYGLGIEELSLKPYGQIWAYTGGTLGYFFTYLWIPAYNTVISTAGNSRVPSQTYTMSLALQILGILYTSPDWQHYRSTHNMPTEFVPYNQRYITNKFNAMFNA